MTITWVCLLPGEVDAQEVISLAGSWRFALDRHDQGVEETWYSRELPDRIQLPGSLPEQGIGDAISTDTPWIGGIVDKSWFTSPEYSKYREPGKVKIPYWLQPDTYYKGAAWYQRDVEVPAAWDRKPTVLFLERADWETQVWCDNRMLGTNNSLATPHEYELGLLAPGKHTITVRVDNRMVLDIGENSHCISDHTQGNWNGIVGRLELRATPPVRIEDVQVYPDVPNRQVRMMVAVSDLTEKSPSVEISVHLESHTGEPLAESMHRAIDFAQIDHRAIITVGPMPIEQAELWDEFHPVLNQVRIDVRSSGEGKELVDQRIVPFGFREFATEDTQFTINGRKTFLRGTLECAIFPRTGHPPMDVASWKRVLRTAKAHGLNHLRFHSWCPPEAAFHAADTLGFYLQVETCWPNQSTTLGDGKPVDQWVYDETDRILEAYGNHPSFVLMAHGNEPGGKQASAYLAKYVTHYRTKDPRRLWTSGAGWPKIPENQYHVSPDPRIQHWGEGLQSRINSNPPETWSDYRGYIQRHQVPVISHEIGQWCVYPNFNEIPKYTGYLKPKNFEVFHDALRGHGLSDMAHRFLIASGRLQAICYKEDIESALRTPGMGGFQLLDLHDFPGQGTALVGLLDPFWESKGYISAEEFVRFCNSTVPLARLHRRVFTTGEKLDAEIEVAHFGPEPIMNAVSTWKLIDKNNRAVANGIFAARTIPIDNGVSLGHLSIDLSSFPAPARYKLVASVGQATGHRFENDWDLWIYPSRVTTDVAKEITVVHALNEQTLSALEAGGKVLLLIPPQDIRGDDRGKVELGFSSIFWNTAWTSRQPPHTLGILCDPTHSLFAQFPTEEHSNWQWWYLIHRAGAMILDDLPNTLRPTVQVIDDWVTARRLGLVFEARIGNGRLVVCSIDLDHDLDSNPVARQFRSSLLSYMESNAFHPETELAIEQLRGLMNEPPD